MIFVVFVGDRAIHKRLRGYFFALSNAFTQCV